MKKVLIIIVIVAAVLCFGAANFHFIYLDGRIKILKKVELSFKNTFFDARGTKRLKLYMEPDLVRAGLMDQLTKEGVEIELPKVIDKD